MQINKVGEFSEVKILIGVATLIVSGTATGQVSWSAPVSIITDSQDARHDTTPKVAVGPDGKVGVAWISQYKEGTSITERLRSNIYVSYSSTEGLAWSGAIQISEPQYYNSEVDIAAGSNNEFLFAWTSGDLFSQYRLHTGWTTDFGGSYTTETITGQSSSNEFDHLHPQVIRLVNKRVMAKSSWYLEWFQHQNMDGHLWRREDAASTWTQTAVTDDPTSLNECLSLPVELGAVTGNNLVAVFHQDYWKGGQHYQRPLVLTSADDGNSWVNRGRLGPDTLDLRELGAGFGANGTGVIIGTKQDLFGSAQPIALFRSVDHGQQWPELKMLNVASGSVNYWGFPSVATDGMGTWLIGLYGYRASNPPSSYGAEGDIFFTVSTDDGITWSTISPVNPDPLTDTAIDTAPTAAYLGEGKWGIFWSRQEGSTDSDIVLSTAVTGASSITDWQLF